MSLTKLHIPKLLHIGFRNRQGTYTGKLAYIIYTDLNGKKRKTKSWESWRDKTIAPLDLDNTPQSGFVLNKTAGGLSGSRWDSRNTYVRVLDPRGFEFEISIPNLLFILQECSSIKGKGIEGEFVYAWDGTELVLLPTSSLEYLESNSYSALQTQKVTKAQMKEGLVYLTKKNEEVMYLGRHFWTITDYIYKHDIYEGLNRGYCSGTLTVTKKKHVFKELTSNGTYLVKDNFSHLAVQISEDVSEKFAEEYDNLMKNCPNIGQDFIIVSKVIKPSELCRNSRTAYCCYINNSGNTCQLFRYGNPTSIINYKLSEKIAQGPIVSIEVTDKVIKVIRQPAVRSSDIHLTDSEAESLEGKIYQIINNSNKKVLREIDC